MNSAIINLAYSLSTRIARLWWPLRAGRAGQVGRLLWDLASRLERADAGSTLSDRRISDLSRRLYDMECAALDASRRHADSLRRRNELRELVDGQELTIARLASELHAERERCARLILRQKRSKA